MAIDGLVMLTERDNFIYHEMLSHPALFSHATPTEVVIVGGGDCGTLSEVVKHTCLQKITQVEIDVRVTRLAEQFFPALCETNDDARIEFVFADAIQWMHQAEAASTDVVIVDSGDPAGPARGLFTTPFYQNCWRVLRPDGLLVQQSESPLIHFDTIIKPMHASMREAGFVATELVYFPLPGYPSGWWSATIASKRGQLPLVREQAVKRLAFSTRYYNHAVHLACFATPQFMLRLDNAGAPPAGAD